MKQIILLVMAGIIAAGIIYSCSTKQKDSPADIEAAANANKMKSADEAAAKALAIIPKLVNEQNIKQMRFKSVEDVNQANLGSAVTIKMIGYDNLLGYKEGMKLEELLLGQEQIAYPIEVNGVIHSSAVIEQNGEHWSISTIADAAMTTKLRAGRTVMKDKPLTVLYSVPGINIDIVVSGESDSLMAEVLNDFPGTDLVKGEPIELNKAIAVLADYVKNFDEKYGEEIRKRKLTN